MNCITVNGSGTQFAYLDSGAPARSAPYLTIIAIHGMGFTCNIFKKVMALSAVAGVRFISIARRGYPGSTAITEAELASATSGTEGEKAAFYDARGLELAMLVDKLIQQLHLCPISEDGKNGGIALLGWSAGTTWTAACISNMDKLPFEARSRMTAHIRAHILEEPPSICHGLPFPPKIWSPLLDTSLPEDQRVLFYMPWVTSYFDHGDISSRSPDVISYCVPSLRRAPSIYNMTAEEIKEMVVEGMVGPDATFMIATQPQSNATYQKSCFSKSVKEMLPRMKTVVLVGDATCSFPLDGMFSIQDDNDKYHGNIQFQIIPGVNHFMQWDEPETAFKAFMDAAL